MDVTIDGLNFHEKAYGRKVYTDKHTTGPNRICVYTYIKKFPTNETRECPPSGLGKGMSALGRARDGDGQVVLG